MASRLGWSTRHTRKRLKVLHARHGGLLFRETEAANAKVWVNTEVLAKVWPSRFGPSPPTALDVRALRTRVERAEEQARLAMETIETLRAELNYRER